MSSAQSTVLIMAGGTGGHVFPALAVAEVLRNAGVRIAWMGGHTGLETRVVPENGIDLHQVRVSGLRGKGMLRLVVAPFALLVALVQSMVIHFRVRPDAVLGMGGFVSGPGGLAAWLLRRPLVIHEQNSIPGMTNRLLAPMAKVVLQAFPGSFGKRVSAKTCGNPLRKAFSQACNDRREPENGMRLLVVGGSLGARAINEVVPQAIAQLSRDKQPEILHQAGPVNLEDTREAYRRAGVQARVEAFIDDMHAAYCWADVVVCRAGALTVSEISAVGVAAVLVPYPYAVDDHQTRNARQLVDIDGGILVPQGEFTAQRLAEILAGTDSDRWQVMAGNARRLARPDADLQVARECIGVMRRASGGEGLSL